MSSKFKRVQALLLIVMMLPLSAMAAVVTDAHTSSPWPDELGMVDVSASGGYSISVGRVVTDSADADWTEPHTGNNVIVATLTGASYENLFTIKVDNCEQPLANEKNYVLSFWVKDPDNLLVSVYYQNQIWLNPSGFGNIQYTSNVASVPDTSRWQKVSIPFTTNNANYATVNDSGADCSSMVFKVNTMANASAGKIYIDDISLVEAPDADTGLTNLINKQYTYDESGSSVTEARFYFDTDYVDEASVVPMLNAAHTGAYTAAKTSDGGQSIITVYFDQPVEKSTLTFILRDIWTRTIADTLAVDSKYITSLWASDICNGTAPFNDGGTYINSQAVSGFQLWKGDCAEMVIDTDVYHGDSGSSYRLSLDGYEAGQNELFRLRAIYMQNPLQTGKTYQLSYWIKKDTYDVTATSLNMAWKYDVATSTAQSAQATTGDGLGTISDTDEWQRVSNTFVYTDAQQPTSTRLYELYIDVRSHAFDDSSENISGGSLSGGNLWIDDIKLVEAPAADMYPVNPVSASPSAGDGRVSVYTPAAFTFEGIVDPQELAASSVVINGVQQSAGDVKISGYCDLDARQSVINILPAGGKWTSAMDYTVSLQNIRDTWGRAFTGDIPVASFSVLPDVDVSYSFCDAGNGSISRIQEGVMKCNASITANTDEVTEVILVVALCKNNTIKSFDLIKVQNLEVGVPKEADTASVTLTLASGESIGDYSLRCFLLDSTDSLRAIGRNVKIFK